MTRTGLQGLVDELSANADRWIAATAIRLGIPLVSNDGIFRGAPGIELATLASG